FALESPVALEPAPNPNPRRFRRMYRVTSSAFDAGYPDLIGLGTGSTLWNEDVQRHYTEGPADSRYRELAEKIALEQLPPELTGDAVARALAIISWLSDHGKYSLQSKHASAEDPTADFLFGDLTGYCVHFAHAAVFLMRSIGIPSRVATGYAVDESVRRGGSAILVTEDRSHAWPEVYVEDVGWVVVDVSPQTVLSAMPPPPDADLQRLLADLMRDAPPVDEAGRALEPLDAMLRRWFWTAGVALARLVVSVLVLLFLIKFWRRWVPHFAGERALPRVAYRAAADRLSELGQRRKPGETREGFADRLLNATPALASLTRLHLAAAFGGHVEPGQARPRFRDLVRELREHFPLWRRMVGLLNPFSWIRTR
ncbi:MAG: transglutaminase domain-containing protein, partial [Myxococcales bacterium]|nr:transglutaminase domain-containing protein [Myxococcales bacterium]